MLKRQISNSIAILTIDSLILLMALFFGDLLVYTIHGVPISLKYSLFLLPAWCVGALVTGQAPGWGLGAIEEFRRIHLLTVALFAFAGVGAFVLQGQPSRIAFFSAYAVTMFCLPFGRMFCRRMLRWIGAWGCSTVLYGDLETVKQILGVLRSESSIGFNPVGIFSNEIDAPLAGVPVLGSLTEHTSLASVAVASIAHLRSYDVTQFVDHTLEKYHKVVLLPDINAGVFAWVTARDFNGMVGLEVTRNLLVPFVAYGKRCVEVILVLLSLPLWLPAVLILGSVVYMGDRTSPFYTQKRVGRYGRQFEALKLRTMIPDADCVLKELLDSDESQKMEWEKFHKLKNDPRITSVGRFLRRFSLDELPQLINVLKGDMALVGPRPLPIYHDQKLSEECRLLRCKVRPGMTGQWQVSGRSDCGLDEMEQWDKFYVRNWSIWMDLYILARTLRVVLFGSGAY